MTENDCSPKGMKSRFIVLCTAGMLWAGLAQAQESANVSGGDATGNGGTASYSIGQVLYSTVNGSTGTITQGVQQPYEITNVGVNETELNISLIAFPNPTADKITLEISNYNNERLSFQLLDIHGKLLYNGQIAAQQTVLNMHSLPAATYFLNIVSPENKKVQSFKIAKN